MNGDIKTDQCQNPNQSHNVPLNEEIEKEINDTSKKLINLQEKLKLQLSEKVLVLSTLLASASFISEYYHNLSLLGLSIIILVTSANFSICTNKNTQTAEASSLIGDLTDCTTTASVPVFLEFYTQNKRVDHRLKRVILTALTRLLPLYFVENDGKIPYQHASKFMEFINLEIEIEFPTLLCTILNGLDTSQSTIFLPAVGSLIAQPDDKQVRGNVREAADAAYLRISESITLTELTNHTVMGWFTDLSQINIWTNYILSREEFTRLHHRITADQFHLIPRMKRGSMYASLAKQKITIDGRRYLPHNLGTSYSLAVIEFARAHKDIIACSVFHILAQSQSTPEKVRKAAYECATYLDQVKAGLIVEKTLLRPLASDADIKTLLQPIPYSSATEEHSLRIVEETAP